MMFAICRCSITNCVVYFLLQLLGMGMAVISLTIVKAWSFVLSNIINMKNI